ncbi:hypothetical protein JP0070_04120 [Helicobacter pylori]|nr:hypothetical protein JP0070_04120 [Helicobacter pylori]
MISATSSGTKATRDSKSMLSLTSPIVMLILLNSSVSYDYIRSIRLFEYFSIKNLNGFTLLHNEINFVYYSFTYYFVIVDWDLK